MATRLHAAYWIWCGGAWRSVARWLRLQPHGSLDARRLVVRGGAGCGWTEQRCSLRSLARKIVGVSVAVWLPFQAGSNSSSGHHAKRRAGNVRGWLLADLPP